MASDLPNERAVLRWLAISFGGTRTTSSPAATSIASRPRERCRQSSIAHKRWSLIALGPREQLLMSRGPSAHLERVDSLACHAVDDSGGVGVAMRVYADYDHADPFPFVRVGWIGRRTAPSRGV